MTKRPLECDYQVDLISSDDESPSDTAMQVDGSRSHHRGTTEAMLSQPLHVKSSKAMLSQPVDVKPSETMLSQLVDVKPSEAMLGQPIDFKLSEDIVVRRARMYQEYMKVVPIPSLRGSVIPCHSWMDLGKSIKVLYGQPLHYLTNIQLKQWDKARFETGEDYQPLDTVVHPLKAETTLWFIEEVHRLTASYHHLGKLWENDPMHHAFVDPIFPKI